MSLNQQQQALIIAIDRQVKAILANGGNEETVLVDMLDLMPAIKTMISTVHKKEIELYFYEYDGFYRYIKMLENLAQRIADGHMTVPD